MARVLVVEDRATVALVLEVALTDEGHNVDLAYNGRTALEKLSLEPRPDIVFVDLHMPDISGREVVTTMRADSLLHDIPVVIVSGSIPKPENMPPDGSYKAFISKPFDLCEVLDTVERLTSDHPVENLITNHSAECLTPNH